MIRVFMAGPIRGGEPGYNLRRAITEADDLRSLGFSPYVPHLLVFWDMICPLGTEGGMAIGREWLAQCDCVYRFGGESAGADQECAEARQLGLPVFTSSRELCAWAASSPRTGGPREASSGARWEAAIERLRASSARGCSLSASASRVEYHAAGAAMMLRAATCEPPPDVSHELARAIAFAVQTADLAGADILRALEALGEREVSSYADSRSPAEARRADRSR